MFTLRIWVFKFGVLKRLFILIKAIGRQMGYHHTVCSQPTGEKIHTNQQCESLAKVRQTTGKI
jgi:hypothetical protein